MPIDSYFPSELRIFLNHIYEYEKGIRSMVLFTMSKEHEEYAINRLNKKEIAYAVQDVVDNKINLYFGRPECIEAIKLFVNKPLNQLSPEEDFMLGAMLGYNICQQCERFCSRKRRAS